MLQLHYIAQLPFKTKFTCTKNPEFFHVKKIGIIIMLLQMLQ